MNHTRIIKEYLKIPSAQNWEALYDFLSEDFIYKTPLREIKGRENYISFEKDRALPIIETPLLLFSDPSQTTYYHINRIEFPAVNNPTLITQQTIFIVNDIVRAQVILTNEINDDIMRKYYPEINLPPINDST